MDAKESLIQSLLRDGYLKTPRIVEAFRAIDRADFVRPEYAGEAYGNYPLPIGEGQTISQPLTVAFMLELLQPEAGDVILDVGAGSGWTTALLAHIVGSEGKVVGVERIPSLCEFGKENVAKYKFTNAEIICADGALDLSKYGPYDRTLAGAAAPRLAGGASPDDIGRAALDSIPKEWRRELKVGGRIVAPIGGSVWLFIKKSESEWDEQEFPGFAFVPLIK